MKIVIEATGPLGCDVRLYDEETGQDLHEMGIGVRKVVVSADTPHRATLEVSLHRLKLVVQGHAKGPRGLAKRILEEIAESGEATL